MTEGSCVPNFNSLSFLIGPDLLMQNENNDGCFLAFMDDFFFDKQMFTSNVIILWADPVDE